MQSENEVAPTVSRLYRRLLTGSTRFSRQTPSAFTPSYLSLDPHAATSPRPPPHRHRRKSLQRPTLTSNHRNRNTAAPAKNTLSVE
jgi:hypothetical protein